MTGPKPFVRLAAPRVVDRPDWPRDLVQFYSENEAVWIDDAENWSIELYPLHDVKRVDWAGLELVGNTPEGWERFDALLIGKGCHFEQIVSVIRAPCCPPGAILTLGHNLDWGNVGTGPFSLACGLVLASSFSEWLWHLEENGWWEYTIGYGIPDLPVPRQRALRAHYLALNPHIEWPEP